MKAVRIHQRGGPEVLELDDVSRPQPGRDEVLIRVAAAGVNQADIGQRNGHYPNLVALPAILGYEVAGTVVGRGADVANMPEGMRVAAHVEGGYAEYAVAKAGETTEVPAAVDFIQAAGVPIQGQTAYLLLADAARLQPGESVLVHAAAGGVGLLVVQLARLMGAGRVIGTGRTEDELRFIRELGADAALDLRTPSWVGQVQQMTQGRGVDVVLDAVDGDLLQQSLAGLAPFGRLVVFGSLSGQMSPLAAQQLIRGCHAVLGFNTPLYPLERKAQANQVVLEHLAAGWLRRAVRTFPLAEVAQAHTTVEAGSAGKIVLIVE